MNRLQTDNDRNALVSVIVPVKNDRNRLQVCLESLKRLSQTAEIIVVDNGSTDGSSDLARSMGVKVLVFPGLKVGALRNRGVNESTGRVLAFVDSDHEVPDDWLVQGLAVLGESPQVYACGSHYLPPVQGTWVQRVWAIHRLRGPERVDSVEWLGSGNLFVRRDAFEKISGFREDLIAAEDVDLCHRLVQASGRIVSDRKIRSLHHGEPKYLVDFIRKEYWRGSSGLRAWVSQGFPVRDLPSFVWPVWHLMVFVLFSISLFLFLLFLTPMMAILNLVALALWIVPSVLLSIRTCLSQRNLRNAPALTVLYWTYGMTRAAALFKAW